MREPWESERRRVEEGASVSNELNHRKHDVNF
jgi:hypothetical protein